MRRGSRKRAVAVRMVKRRSRKRHGAVADLDHAQHRGRRRGALDGEGAADPQGGGAVPHDEVVVELDQDAKRERGRRRPAARRRPAVARRRARALACNPPHQA